MQLLCGESEKLQPQQFSGAAGGDADRSAEGTGKQQRGGMMSIRATYLKHTACICSACICSELDDMQPAPQYLMYLPK